MTIVKEPPATAMQFSNFGSLASNIPGGQVRYRLGKLRRTRLPD
jgi:hypothetical protein